MLLWRVESWDAGKRLKPNTLRRLFYSWSMSLFHFDGFDRWKMQMAADSSCPPRQYVSKLQSLAVALGHGGFCFGGGNIWRKFCVIGEMSWHLLIPLPIGPNSALSKALSKLLQSVCYLYSVLKNLPHTPRKQTRVMHNVNNILMPNPKDVYALWFYVAWCPSLAIVDLRHDTCIER